MAERSGMAGGRFADDADALFRAFNDSLRFDWRLAQADITGSIAWARALNGAGVLTAAEATKLTAALEDLRTEVAEHPSPPLDSGAEDVHSWVESRLVMMVGDLGKKLHTGRSRNDQVATDLRLWVREQIAARRGEIRDLQLALIDLGHREAHTPFPGYTHLQPAQPIVFGHWCHAYVEMLSRDAARFEGADARADACPLGAAALAGTAYAIDRQALAMSLGFTRPCANSLDAVSDRDFVVESLAAAALCAVHLSRFAEDIIIYASREFGLIVLDDGVTSGSSLMPQKKNPDALELIRGKSGRITAAHASLLMTLKGTPLTYNKDQQEDKEPIFESMEHLSMCLRMAARVVRGITLHREACATAAAAGYTNATELADYLVRKGVAFRDAHSQAARIVTDAIAMDKPLLDLPMEVIRRHAPVAMEDVFDHLTLDAALARRAVAGGTSPTRVIEALDKARAALD